MTVLRSANVRYPGGPRAAYGMVAYLLGYLLAYPLARARLADALVSTAIETPDGPVTAAQLLSAYDVSLAGWQGTGWLFYNAHLVSIQMRGGEFGRAIVEANVLTSAGGLLYLLAVVPPLALAGAGAMVTRDVPVSNELRFDFGTGGSRYAINGGLVTMLGYMPLAFLGTIVFTHGYLGAFGPSILGGWIVAGGLYPLVFGAVGGYLGRRVAGRQGHESSSDTRETGW